ncbi:MAG: hypothetical protein OXC80_12105 [Gammaproteobacteria bacterium]|nr:hypothetical protein [Gammaproteobacteria bacterium]
MSQYKGQRALERADLRFVKYESHAFDPRVVAFSLNFYEFDAQYCLLVDQLPDVELNKLR